MKKTPFENLRDRMEACLRGLCGRISPERRIVVIAAALALFAVVNCWIMIRGICSIGRESDRIEHISLPDVPPPDAAEEPGPLELEIENFLNEHFNTESHDSTTLE